MRSVIWHKYVHIVFGEGRGLNYDLQDAGIFLEVNGNVI